MCSVGIKAGFFMDIKMDLFDNLNVQICNNIKQMPLASRMRPESLEEFIGQQHILCEGKLLTRLIKSDRIGSIILFGPPGTGKTTLAHIISKSTKSFFQKVNAVTSNVSELRQIVDLAKKKYKFNNQRTILFVDEIHRFNKSQQDILLPEIEDNNIGFIGATTLNPCFALTSPLISRSNVFQLEPLSDNEIVLILKNALKNEIKGLGSEKVIVDDKDLLNFAVICDGDVRKALNSLEIAVNTAITNKNGYKVLLFDNLQESVQKKFINYDRDGDAHYDTISAFIKSMRGSDPDAAVYWLAKMLEAGEDPRFIARRIIICASEDVGNADPHAINVAVSALQALEFAGMPEARIPLAQAAIYIATAPKSNAVITAIDKAISVVRNERTEEIPLHLRDSHYSGAQKLSAGKGYLYPHDFPGHYVKQEYRPGKEIFYNPSDQGYEEIIQKRLEVWKQSIEKN